MSRYAEHPVMYETALAQGQGMRHMSDDFLFTYLIEGSLCLAFDELEYELHSGQGAVVASHSRITLENRESQPALAVHIHLSTQEIEEYLFHNTSVCTPSGDDTRPVHIFEPHILLHCLSDGIEAAIAQGFRANRVLTNLKIQECIHILVTLCPEIHYWFSAMCHARKIDLRTFMELNYKRNVPLERFAEASGRSLSTFRRDFQQVFGVQPGKWLLVRRLDEAYNRISHGERPSDILVELGFESFSHFTRTFKERFGSLPSQVLSRHKG